MAVLVCVLTSLKAFGNYHSFGVQTIRKMMLHLRVYSKLTPALAHKFS
jgi:hypothetical protein